MLEYKEKTLDEGEVQLYLDFQAHEGWECYGQLESSISNSRTLLFKRSSVKDFKLIVTAKEWWKFLDPYKQLQCVRNFIKLNNYYKFDDTKMNGSDGTYFWILKMFNDRERLLSYTP